MVAVVVYFFKEEKAIGTHIKSIPAINTWRIQLQANGTWSQPGVEPETLYCNQWLKCKVILGGALKKKSREAQKKFVTGAQPRTAPAHFKHWTYF